ncbi:MAG: DUF1684 domain-containing protein [Flammeovirgaceae bacterium]|nr:MAG: DUF1684 domain-containing protein [Flammeovirgaceae bacterium]
MSAKKILVFVFGVVATAAVIYSFIGNNKADYITTIEKARKEKDHYLRTSPDSPFKDDPQSFKGLTYYPVDPAFRVQARLVPIEQKKVVVLPTSDGQEKKYIEYGYAEFKLNGVANRLLILEIMDMGPYRGTLFLAFGDATSARETYGAGRYLDVKNVKGSHTITLDFNEAYNPYCAYNENYSCPLPPRENLLVIPITAGEMNYPK